MIGSFAVPLSGRRFPLQVVVLLMVVAIINTACGASTPKQQIPTAVATAGTSPTTYTSTPDTTAPVARSHWDVREFGAIPDDSRDDTDAIQAAITSAADADQYRPTVFLPAGVYRIRASTGSAFDGLLLKSGVSLVGEGEKQSVLKLMTEMVESDWRSIRLLLVESDTRVADLTLDGSRADIDRTEVADTSTILLRTRAGASNVVWERLTLHDAYANLREGFAMSVAQATDVVIRDIVARDNDGSGISIDGDIYGDMPGRVTIDSVKAYGNGWQGITFWGATATTASNIIAFNNALSGINVEWSNGITIRDSITYGNGRRGFNTYGVSTNIRVERLRSQGNGVGNRDGAEIGMEAWPWHWPDPDTGVTESGIIQDIGFYDCHIRPARGYPHVLVNPDVEGSTSIASVPHTIILASPGAKRWIFAYDSIRVRGRELRRFSEETYGVPLVTQTADLIGRTMP